MSLPNYIVYYVEKPSKSGAFYAALFDGEHIPSSENYSIVLLKNGIKLGFWSKQAVSPKTDGVPGSSELCVMVDNQEAVDSYYQHWQQRHVDVIQKPMNMGYGYTFLGQCPDGHRLRVAYIFD
ncbi:VOC family protein [Legionella sp. W05-934-2]|jgi:predicted lactoylglutathione lyase|uniref:VOC family protein n=1 Tax=Legionella sp. W05-934-2 TaxID=1198649 RepID=UPI00346301EC